MEQELKPATPLIAPDDDLLRSFGEDFQALATLVEHSRSEIHGFMERLLAQKGISNDDGVEIFARLVRVAQSAVENVRSTKAQAAENGSLVPKLVHRIWLTDPRAPAEPPRASVQKWIDEASSYSSRGWRSWFWTVDPFLIPNTSAMIKHSGAPIELRSFEQETSTGEPWEDNFRRLLADRKFPFASDLLRMKLLLTYGGIYADMGARFRNIKFMDIVRDQFDYAFVFWKTLFFQNSLMMMPQNSLVARLFIEIANDPYLYPKSMFCKFNGTEEGIAFSGLLITFLCLFAKSTPLKVCPLLANGRLVEWHAQKSWYVKDENGSGKFGNAYIPESEATYINRNKFTDRIPHPVFIQQNRSIY